MTTIKAIETRYAGHRFRSRLEARWAVYFDTLGVGWRYEPEGFETSAGWYLPDFQVDLGFASSRVFFEVKGAPLRQDEAERIAALVSDEPRDGFTVLALSDIPDPRKVCFSDRTIWLDGWGGRLNCHGEWTGGSVYGWVGHDGVPDLGSGPDFRGPIRADLMQNVFRRGGSFSTLEDGCTCGPPYRACPRSQMVPHFRALTAARSARFEHGETPRTS